MPYFIFISLYFLKPLLKLPSTLFSLLFIPFTLFSSYILSRSISAPFILSTPESPVTFGQNGFAPTQLHVNLAVCLCAPKGPSTPRGSKCLLRYLSEVTTSAACLSLVKIQGRQKRSKAAEFQSRRESEAKDPGEGGWSAGEGESKKGEGKEGDW